MPEPKQKVAEELHPRSRADEGLRAGFFAHSMYSRCKSQLREAIERGAVNNNGKRAIDALLHPSAADEAAKKVAVMSVHLTGLESGGVDNSDWFIDFLFSSLRTLDRITPQPPAKRMIEAHGQWVREEIIEGVARNAMAGLDVGDSKSAIAKQLEILIESDQAYRAELLTFSLTQDPKSLKEHQMLLGMSDL